MNAGALNRKLDIEAPQRTETDSGEIAPAWRNVATVWASIRPLTAREVMVARQSQLQTSHRIEVRYTPALTSDCRLTQQRPDGTVRVFNIAGILNPDDRNVALAIDAVEVTNG